MSQWTYVNGVIEVDVPGRTQAECRYILETILDHLPKVYGSEHNMNFYIIELDGHNQWSNTDEFCNHSNLHDSSFKMQSQYMITVEGKLRDTTLDDTIKNINRWLCRLCKRVITVDSILITMVDSYTNAFTINENSRRDERFRRYIDLTNPDPLVEKQEEPWWNYLMWEWSE